MNGSLESIKAIVDGLNKASIPSNVEVVISPPFPYLKYTKDALAADSKVEVAAQNSFDRGNGAFTGEVSVAQIKDVGSTWVILGHSERRTIIKESDEFIADKTKYALDNGLKVILCIGETLEERKSNETLNVCNRQIDAVIAKVSDPKDWANIVIAYEPVWAIGTGMAATPDDAQEVHSKIRAHLKEKLGAEVADSVRILYGGSVNGKNATTFNDKPDIDGYLVGGASLKPEFLDIIKSRA